MCPTSQGFWIFLQELYLETNQVFFCSLSLPTSLLHFPFFLGDLFLKQGCEVRSSLAVVFHLWICSKIHFPTIHWMPSMCLDRSWPSMCLQFHKGLIHKERSGISVWGVLLSLFLMDCPDTKSNGSVINSHYLTSAKSCLLSSHSH